MSPNRCSRCVLCLFVVGLLARGSAYAAEHDAFVKKVISDSGATGGFVVHLGVKDGKLTKALRVDEKYRVHGLAFDDKSLSAARATIQASNQYGAISVDELPADGGLPYIDNMVNLLVASQLGEIPLREVMRVLTPGGTAMIRDGEDWNLHRKPRPEDIDEWTHYLYDARGNAVAHDEQVGPPRHLQWLGTPRWSRHHDRMASLSAMVSAGGRVFYIMDEGSRVSIQMPPKWTLVARDAFNGTILWKQPIPTWHHHLWPLKSGPTQLARRLVATRDTVYVTLGLREPITALDAATGQPARTFKGTGPTEELIHEGGVVFALVNPGDARMAEFGPQQNVGDQGRVGREFRWNEKPRRIVAVNVENGVELWSRDSVVVPLTMAADNRRVLYHDGKKLVCLDRATGETIWTSLPIDRRQRITFNFGPKLVIYDDVVLFAGGNRTMVGLDIETGKQLWTAPHAQSGYQSPEDLLVAGGLVWNAPTTRTQDTGIFRGRDPRTGELKIEFAPDVETYWFHHRCYIAKATDKFLLPSRTGIEFVDPKTKHWDINHWVRGGCLYGIMPCNGLVYAPPHNCACYPEAKLYGLNALATSSTMADMTSEKFQRDRLQHGPALAELSEASRAENDWPTYRRDNTRSGSTSDELPEKLQVAWTSTIGGSVSPPTIADGRLYVAQKDQHAVHALDVDTGETLWTFTVGGRVDSPPTWHRGRVVFGSTDGWVYSLRASDGQLAWRFRGAPADRRLMAFEQLESVWPIHGSVLVLDNEVWLVAGRSNYLDGGLRLLRLKATDGELISESLIDELDPETESNLQERLKILNMPVGLTDILSSNGASVFMRSQQFDLQGNRLAIGPHAGQPGEQGAVQRGDAAHLFAPMGFLDDTWFHRSYWVYGRSFAGGHSGYYQAGKFAPSGRILVTDEDNVYGFGRKPQYYRWTTTIEHQLFSTSKQPPKEAVQSWNADDKTVRRTGATNMVRFQKSESLNPSGTALAVEAFVNSAGTRGVVVARGGPSVGYALWIEKGRPVFSVRASADQLVSIAGKERIVGRWTHLVGVLRDDRTMHLYVDGQPVASAKADRLIPSDPVQSLEVGADVGGPVASYRSPNAIVGAIDEVRVYRGEFTAADAAERFARSDYRPEQAEAVLACSFDDGQALDSSGKNNHGKVDGARRIDGRIGSALRFRGTRGANQGSFVQHHWNRDLPLLVRAMVKAKDRLVVAGPPDLIDEESTFQRIVQRDATVENQLAEQNDALEGEHGAILQMISAKDGRLLSELKLDSLPTWDGFAVAGGRLYLTTVDGQVVCFASP